jgi:ATP-dependent DNA helicase PIF1
MFLNNTYFNNGLANGTIGVVTAMNYANNTVEVTFPTSSGITLTSIRRVTNSFLINGAPCSRTQFPLQNAFALTVHKTQGLTLPHVSLSIDDTMFACGQVYVAFSRATSWENLDLYAFEEDQIHIDQEVITENQRLWSLFIQRFPQQ